jgi:hypothetical protein
MEAWALRGGFGRRVAFICISVEQDAPAALAAAVSFGTRLQLRGVLNSFAERAPRTGQLSCSGLIGLSPDGTVLLPASAAYLQHGPAAFR